MMPVALGRMSEQRDDPDAEPTLPLADSPADGTPSVTDTDADLADIAARIGSGTGPVAIDAERASGHRYGQRAFLLQFRRDGSGTSLVDPTGITDFAPLQRALAEAEWILHSATQDLTCLDELGLRPDALFDTEVAARLLGLPRVGLAALTEQLLGVRLAKGHGSADWSRRPLPERWVTYAALDVEFLIPMRDILATQLIEMDRWTWAEQEFAALCHWKPRIRPDPWRRTSGIHAVKNPKGLAVARQMWQARDAEAQRRDIAPGRILPDSALVAAAKRLPTSRSDLERIPEFVRQRRRLDIWWTAVRVALAEPPIEAGMEPTRGLAPDSAQQEAYPPPRAWQRRNPEAAKRLSRARHFIVSCGEELDLAPEVLIAPDCVRQLAWSPPDPATPGTVTAKLVSAGVRQWQVELTAAGLSEAMSPNGPDGALRAPVEQPKTDSVPG